jgi:hypothetical protein
MEIPGIGSLGHGDQLHFEDQRCIGADRASGCSVLAVAKLGRDENFHCQIVKSTVGMLQFIDL